jgi:hypothetical protein
MAIQTFTAAQVLTAAQMNALQGNDYNQTVSTKTASYTLVAADKGTKVVMNSASATTITVNTSLFSAGDTLTILNIAAGVCTVTAGTATVSTTGSLALAQNGGGTLYFTSAGVSVFQADGVTAAASGLTLVSATTIGSTVASVTVSSAFSATYDTYYVTISGGVASTGCDLGLHLGATTSGYKVQLMYATYGSSLVGAGGSAAASFSYAGIGNTSTLNMGVVLQNPFLAKPTQQTGFYASSGAFGPSGGYLDNTTSYTAFTVTPGSGTLTGGTIRVYGYQNS